MTPQIIELLLLLIFLDLSYEDDHNNDCYYEFSALQSTQAVPNSGAHDILILIEKKKSLDQMFACSLCLLFILRVCLSLPLLSLLFARGLLGCYSLDPRLGVP